MERSCKVPDAAATCNFFPAHRTNTRSPQTSQNTAVTRAICGSAVPCFMLNELKTIPLKVPCETISAGSGHHSKC